MKKLTKKISDSWSDSIFDETVAEIEEKKPELMRCETERKRERGRTETKKVKEREKSEAVEIIKNHNKREKTEGGKDRK